MQTMISTRSGTLKPLSRREWAFFGVILIYAFFPSFAGLFRIAELAGGPAIIPENPRALAQPLPIVLHILGSLLFCLLGAVQFLPGVRRRHPGAHRMTGRIVAVAGGVSALTGLWMTHSFAFPTGLQGVLLYWVRMAVSLSMLGLIVWAIIAIRAGNIAGHSAAMLRAYAIGLGASTQAVLGISWMIAFGTEPQGLMRDGIMTLAWALNLLVAEILIRRMRPSIMRPV